MAEQRNNTNFLRVMAIALVINSHMDSLYPRKFAFLASGGMMGNALFFMLSAWGLILSMKAHPRGFADWYGRRIERIYHAVWVAVVLLSFPIGIHNGWIRLDNLLDELNKFFYPPFWFLQALMIYYVIVYFVIRNYSVKRLLYVALPVLAFYVLYYVRWLDLTAFSVEGTPFRLIFYLLVVFWGLYLGSRAEKIKFQGPLDILLLLLSIALIYGHKFLMQRGMFPEFQFVEQLAAFPMLYYSAKIANSTFIRDTVMGSRYLGWVLAFISGMTLELFMVNNSLDFLDTHLGPFPLNAIALLSINLALSLLIFYCAKPVARIFNAGAPPEQAASMQGSH